MSENPAGKVPVLAVWREAWAFFAANWRMFVPAALAMAAISQVGRAATLMIGGGGMEMTSVGLLSIMAPALIAGRMFTAAILRKAVRDQFIPSIGMTLRGDEVRLLGVWASVFLLAIPVGIVLMILLSATLFRSIAATPEEMEVLAADPEALMQAVIEGLGVGGLVTLAVVLTVVFSVASGLLALADAATIGERRIMIFQAWSWMKGNVLRILGVFVLTAALVVLLNMVVGEAVSALFFSVSGDTISLLPYLLALVVITFLNALIAMPVSAMGAILYRGLRPPELAAR